MNQRIINVMLLERDDKEDVLRFIFDDDKFKDIRLNSDSCQSDIRALFNEILSISVTENIQLEYHVEDGYSRGLYKDVCHDYINEIQSEIEKSTAQIRKQLV